MTATKTKLFACLKRNQGRWVSGEWISTQLGLSRTAIWKQMNNLKTEGHQIRSAPKKGYMLMQCADVLTAEEIRVSLQTTQFGRSDMIVLKETDSTNRQAKTLAVNGAAEGTVVVAENQLEGRGRRGRQWLSAPGRNIMMSIVLRPTLAPAQAPQITLMCAVAIATAVQQASGLAARIKWPNDILIKGRKIAGILTEISTEMDMVDFVVVGIGLNVNTPREMMSEQIRPIATSIQAEIGQPLARTDMLCAVLYQLEKCYLQLQQDGFTAIMQQWRAMTDIIGQCVRVDIMNRQLTGIVETVDDNGVLVVKDAQGKVHRIFSGDVTRVRHPR